MRRDRLLTIVLAIVLGNLAYYLGTVITRLTDTPQSAFLWALLVADIIAILGVFYFIRTYIKGRKLAKQKPADTDKGI